MNDLNMPKLLKEHTSAKIKLILGIVFTVLAEFLSLVGFATIFVYVGIAFILLSIPCFCVGIPLLIIGIITTVKTNRKIALARMTLKNVAAGKQQNPAQKPTSAPQNNVSEVKEATSADTTPDAPAHKKTIEEIRADLNMDEEPESFEPEPPKFTARTQAKSNATPDLDWQKYNPLDSEVSYDKTKDYQFHRADGFVGSVPQKFVDRTFPKCPLCCSKEAHWTISQHNQMSWKGNLYLFKCSHCESIISMSMPDVTTLGNGGSGVVHNPSVGLANLMVKASSGKEAGAVYAVIESVGNSGISTECEGKEFKLEDLQDMYLR